MRSRWLISLSVAASIIYLATQHWRPWQPFPGSALVKGFAVGPLALLAWQARRERHDAGLLALALAFCTAGDILLDLDPRFFAFGLALFLLAHITYTGLFVRNRTLGIKRDWKMGAAVLCILLYSVTLSIWIVPSTGALAVPVILYVCALTIMVSSALVARLAQRWVGVGAVLFLVSDSLLAIHKFKQPVPLRDYLVWTTYYLGQCGIAFGFLASAAYPARFRSASR